MPETLFVITKETFLKVACSLKYVWPFLTTISRELNMLHMAPVL